MQAYDVRTWIMAVRAVFHSVQFCTFDNLIFKDCWLIWVCHAFNCFEIIYIASDLYGLWKNCPLFGLWFEGFIIGNILIIVLQLHTWSPPQKKKKNCHTFYYYFYKFSRDSDREKKVWKWSIFDEVIRRTKVYQIFGPPCIFYSGGMTLVIGLLLFQNW